MNGKELTAESTVDFPVKALGIGLLVWFGTMVTLTLNGAFDMSDGSKPLPILLAITTPPLLVYLAFKTSEQVRAWVLSVDIHLLILPHALRMVGMGFIFLYFYDQLPALFAFPAGLGDAIAAAGAVYLTALALLSKSVPKNAIRNWNTFAFLDFVIAVAMGVLTRTNGLLQLPGHPVSDPMGLFPLAVVPAFFVPFFVSLHLMIMLKLKYGRST